MLSPTAAALVAMTASFAVLALATAWYVVPWLRRRPTRDALAPLLWIHVGRYIALQLFSAQQSGVAASDTAVREIAYGDLAGAVLAVLALVALRLRWSRARLVVWAFVLATVVDLGNALRLGLGEGLFETAEDLSWLILTFYVPALWISVGLVVWLMLRRTRDHPADALEGGHDERRQNPAR